MPVGRRGGLGDELLGEDVERGFGDADPVEVPVLHGDGERRALDQIVAGRREQPSLRGRPEPVPRASHPLQRHGDGAGRAELADEIHRAHINPEFQRGGGHHGADFRGGEPPLGLEPGLAGEAAVVGEDRVAREPFAERVGQPLRHPPGVHEHQGGPVFPDQGGDPVADVLHDFVGGHRPEFAARDLDPEIEVAPASDRDHGGPAFAPGAQEAGHLGGGPDGGGEADALQRAARQPVEPFEGEREVAAPFVAGEGVDLVHDHGVGAAEERPAAVGGEEQVERFRRRDQDVRRFPAHPGALGGRGVAGPEFGADSRSPARPGPRRDLRERRYQVPPDVGAQRLERRDIDHPRPVLEPAAARLPRQPVHREEEGGERLAGTRRGGDQRIAPGGDGRPAAQLRFGGRLEAVPEPAGDRRIEAGERVRQMRNRGSRRSPEPQFRTGGGTRGRAPSRSYNRFVDSPPPPGPAGPPVGGPLDREHLAELDRRDPLARFRERFALPEGVLYLDGNSLGPPSRRLAERMERAVTGEWGADLVASWNRHGWFRLPERVGARLAPLLGAAGEEVIAADSVSLNLFKLLGALLRQADGRGVVLADGGTSRPTSTWRRGWPASSKPPAPRSAWWPRRTSRGRSDRRSRWRP